ncbi:hypothetical protein SCUP234_06013 [Seiridium cupressi]
MWRSKRARLGSGSDGSISIQPLLEDDRLYLPASDVYLTTTRSGKPALARKKNRDLLRDHGFDLLGQSFGVPSRADFDRGRRPAIIRRMPRSRSAQSALTPRVIEIDSDDDDFTPASKVKHIDEYPHLEAARSSSRSTVTPKSILRSPKTFIEHRPPKTAPIPLLRPAPKFNRRSRSLSRPAPSERRRFAVYDSEDEGSPTESASPLYHPGGAFYTPLASPHVHPSVASMSNYFQPSIPGQYPLGWPGNGLSYPSAATTPGNNSSNLPPQQAQSFGVQYPGVPAFALPQPASTNMMPQTQTGVTAVAYSQPSFAPPPPPPPPGIAPTSISTETGHATAQGDERIKEHFEKVVKPQLDNLGKTQTEDENRQNQQPTKKKDAEKKTQDNKKKTSVTETLNDQVPPKDATPKAPSAITIMHTHRGEKPEPDYCRRCIITADYTDSEATESVIGNEFLMTPALPIEDSGHDHVTPTSKSNHGSGASRRNLHKKHSRRDSFLKAVSSVLPSGRRSRRADSLSTPEEASSRGSSQTGELRVRRQKSTPSRPQSTKLSHPRSPLCAPPAQMSHSPDGRLTTEPDVSEPHPQAVSRSMASHKSALNLHKSPTGRTSGPASAASKATSRSKGSRQTNSAAPNFSYKFSHLSSHTSGIQNDGADEKLGSRHQGSFTHDGNFAITGQHEEKSSKNSPRHSSKPASSTKKSTSDLLDTESSGRRKSVTSSSKHKSTVLVEQTASDMLDDGKSNNQDDSPKSQTSQNEDLWDFQGIFNKAPNFDEPVDAHATKNLNFSDTSRHAPSEGVHIGSTEFGFDGSRRCSGDSGSSGKKSSRKAALDDTTILNPASSSGEPCGVPLPGSNGTRYTCSNSASPAQESNTKGHSEHPAASHSTPDFKSEPDLLSPDKDAFDSVPSTPVDGGWDDFEPHPQIRRDSWENNQDHFEQQAEHMVEQMVEDELMRAGKHSGLFGLGSWGSSTASTYPTLSSYLSHLTTSLVSIESCGSDEVRNDGNAHYQLSNESDLKGSDTVDERDFKQPELSSHEDRPYSRRSSCKSNSKSSHSRSSLSSKHLSHTSSHVKSRSNNDSPRNSNTQEHLNDDGGSSSSNKSSFDFLPPPQGSSIRAHTGHSEDNVTHFDTLRDNTSVTSSTRTPRRRIRRFGLS